jgi:hypothetical protein
MLHSAIHGAPIPTHIGTNTQAHKNLNILPYEPILIIESEPVNIIETLLNKERAASTHLDVVSFIGMYCSCLRLTLNVMEIPARHMPAT